MKPLSKKAINLMFMLGERCHNVTAGIRISEYDEKIFALEEKESNFLQLVLIRTTPLKMRHVSHQRLGETHLIAVCEGDFSLKRKPNDTLWRLSRWA